jgi:succinate dehydrogenase/fumarate reductase flavoprotein subunit
MSAGAGAIRDEPGLWATRSRLRDVGQTVADAWGGSNPPLQRDAIEVANMLVASRAIVDSAVRRRESRGSHFRTDFPEPDPGWAGRRQRVRLGVEL